MRSWFLVGGGLAFFAAACVRPGPPSSGDDGGEPGDPVDAGSVFERKLRFGYVRDQIGGAATGAFGTATNNFALEVANAALKETTGMFRGLQFEELSGDSANKAAQAVTVASDLVRNQGAKAIISAVSGEDIALNEVQYDADTSNDLNVPIVCFACGAVSLNNPTVSVPNDPALQGALRNANGWNFRTVTSERDLARVLINILLSQPTGGDKNGDGKFKVVVYAPSEPGGVATAEAIKLTAKGARPDAIVEYVLHDPTMNSSTHNWSADVMAILDNRDNMTGQVDVVPDAIVEATYPEYAVYITSALHKAQSTTRLLHYPGFRIPKAIVVLGDAANGQEGVSPVVIDGVQGEQFAQLQVAAFGTAPALYDANLVDARNLIMLAILHAVKVYKLDDPGQVTGEQVRNSLERLNDPGGTLVGVGKAEFAKALDLIEKGQPISYDGASGPCHFDSAHNVQGRVSYWKVENKLFVDKVKFDCVQSSACLQMP